MKGFSRIFIYLFYLLLFAGTVSCSDSLIDNGNETGQKPFSGTLSLCVSAGDADVSSRSLNMNGGAAISINSLWVGVFDMTTGQRLGSTQIDGFNKTVSGGTPSRNMITVDFYSDYSNPEVFVVGVANYEDVVTCGNIPVIDAVRNAGSWKELVAIDIDARSAYAGDKGENSVSQSPFLMGYFLESAGLSRVPKFNQFDPDGDSGAVHIYPENASSAMTVKLFTDESGSLYVPTGALVLRRLVSNINVSLKPGPGIEISDVSYMVFNQPRAVYLVQRRTDTASGRSFADWQKYSPNRSDCFLTENGTFAGESMYEDDAEWRTDVSSDGRSFSFQHFENKHWGFGDIASFSDREAKNPDGTLKALSPGGESPYNSYASYFKIRMHVVDHNTGRNGDLVYTIHEGLCNTDDGRKADSDAVKMKDFGSFRNTNYTYTVNVNGMENVVVNAAMEYEDENHNNGQEGTIWQLVYANGDDAQIPDAGGVYGDVRFNESADIAFRVYGTDTEGRRFDLCYNFPENGSSLLGGFWPENDSETVFTDNPADLAQLPSNLLAGLRVTDGSADYTVEEFLNGFDSSKSYRFRFDAYNGPWEDDPRENMRALYLFDRNEIHSDFDGCSRFGKIYVAEQYPFDDRPTLRFNKNNVIGHTSLHQTAENKWCGCVNSRIELVWAHDQAFEGYYVEAGGFREKITKEDLPSYLSTVSGKKAVVYPYITDRIAASETPYDITITPIPADKSYKGEPTVISGYLAVSPTKWIIKSTPLWMDLNINGKTYADVEYRGLELFQDNSTKNSSVKGSYLSFGGSSNLTNRVLRFFTVKSGKLTLKVCSNAGLPSGAPSNSLDTSRYVMASLVKYDDAGNQIVLKTISLEDQYVPYSNTTADRVFDLVVDEPCYVYVTMSGGNIRVYSITFDAY